MEWAQQLFLFFRSGHVGLWRRAGQGHRMKEELDIERHSGRRPGVDPTVFERAKLAPLSLILLPLPPPLAVARRHLGVQVQRTEDVAAGVGLRQKQRQVHLGGLPDKIKVRLYFGNLAKESGYN